MTGHLVVEFAGELLMFLAPRDRRAPVQVAIDGTSTLTHVVESLGVPRTEIGELRADGRHVPAGHRPVAGERVYVCPVPRPQRVTPPRFLLDVHLGTLARRMRLVGVDTAYANDLDDDTLVDLADEVRRVLLTQDRGLLRRRALWLGAYVRGAGPDEQFADVLDRFAPPLAPWTRCVVCNGTLSPVGKAEVEHLLEPGTRRTQNAFARCHDCGRVYWPGAHHDRLAAIVETAVRAVSGGPSPSSR